MSDDKDKPREGHSRFGNILETAFTIISVVVIAATIVYLLVMMGRPETAPSFELTHSAPEQRANHWHVVVVATNLGDKAAREVDIEGRPRDSPADEASNARINWLPGNSTREAVLVFDEAPTGGLELSVKGYMVP